MLYSGRAMTDPFDLGSLDLAAPARADDTDCAAATSAVG